MVLCGLMVDASFSPSCRTDPVVNTFGPTFWASGLILVSAVDFDPSALRSLVIGTAPIGVWRPQPGCGRNVTANVTDLYFFR
jgi:hypothetical protein